MKIAEETCHRVLSYVAAVQGHGYGDFSTSDRYADLPSGLSRAEWTTLIAGCTTTGEPVPTAAKAIDTCHMLPRTAHRYRSSNQRER